VLEHLIAREAAASRPHGDVHGAGRGLRRNHELAQAWHGRHGGAAEQRQLARRSVPGIEERLRRDVDSGCGAAQSAFPG
jgi:hypothetical protein